MDKVKKSIKSVPKIFLLILLIIVMIAAIAYKVIEWTIETVNTSAVSVNTHVNFTPDGVASSEKSYKELWDEMVKAGYGVEKILKNPEELEKLINAELITQIPDTREDVTKEIDWDAVLKEQITNKSKTSKINVLFVGNSKTYVNDLDIQFQKLAESLGKSTEVDKFAISGMKLEEALSYEEFKTKADSKQWDYVVLQEQTEQSLDGNKLNDGAIDIIDYVKQKSPSVIPVFAAWSVNGDYNEEEYKQATNNYEASRDQIGGSMAYIADAILQCHSKYDMELFNGDQHPNNLGTYIAACAIYEAIYEEKTKNAKYAIDGITDDEADKIQSVVDELQKGNSVKKIIQGIIKFKRHDTNGNEYYLTYATPSEFNEYVDTANSDSASEEQKMNAIDFVSKHFTLKKGGSGAVTTPTAGSGINNAGSTSGIDTSAAGDGYDGIFISSHGVAFKDYKQTKGSYAGDSYRGDSIEAKGCLPTSMSIIMDAAGFEATPKTVANAIDCGYDDAGVCYDNGLAYLRSNGLDVMKVDNPSTNDILNWTAEGKVIIGYTNGGDIYSTGAHYFTVVDSNEKGQCMVLNPGSHGKGSGWFNLDPIAFAWLIDASNFPKTSTTNTETNTNNTENSSGTSNLVASPNDIITDVSEKIVNAAKSTPSPGESLCLMWVEDVYDNAGYTVNRDGMGSAYLAWQAHGISTDKTNIPVGAAVYGTGSGKVIVDGKGAGHVGIYIGNGIVRDNIGSIRECTLEEWITGSNYGVIDGKQGWLGWGWEDGNKTRGLEGSKASSLSTTNPNFTGEIDKSEGSVNDGWEGTYTSHTGIKYKDYKQAEPSPWADHGGKYGGSISSAGCGPTSLAIILSGILDDSITPLQTFDELGDGGYNWEDAGSAIVYGFKQHGFNTERVESPSAQDIMNYLKDGKVMVASLSASIFYGGNHCVAIVDANTETDEVFVMDPGHLGYSQWVTARYIEGVCRYVLPVDAGEGGISGGEPNNVSTDTRPGYQAIVATVSKTERETQLNGETAEAAAQDLGVGIEQGTVYYVSTSTVNYEELVKPYDLPFDFLWSLLVIGQSKGFVMDLADLAYNSEIEVSIYDEMVTVTNIDSYSYSEPTNAMVSGYVSYSDDDWNVDDREGVDTHEHKYPDSFLKDPPTGNISKSVTTYNNTVNAVLTKAHTWIADYDLTYDSKDDPGADHTEEEILENQSRVYGVEKVNETDDCEIVKGAIDKLVTRVNQEFKEKALLTSKAQTTQVKNQLSTKGTYVSGNTIPNLGATPHGDISADDVDRSNLRIVTWVDRVNINHNSLERTDKQSYVALTPTLIIKDNKKVKSTSNSDSNDKKTSNQPSQTTVNSLDNFLFIGDSRYDGYERINGLGNNVKNVGVSSARIDEWVDVANSGGRGNVQNTPVDITGSYSGICIQLGANSIGYGVNTATSQMQNLIIELKKLHINTPIFVNSCLPDTEISRAEMNAFNNGVKEYCDKADNVYYIDISANLLDSSGYIKSQYTQDGCHLSSSEAESIFANNIKDGVLGKSVTTGGTSSVSTGESFVSLFRKRKYRKNKNNILSATSWLFEALEKNDKTKNMVDTVRYLLYKATDTDYGVLTLDKTIFDPTNFSSVKSDTTSNGSGSSKDFISFIVAMEGEGQRSGDNYVISSNPLDGNWDVGPGVVVRFPDGSTRYTDVIGEPYVGQIITPDQLWEMFNRENKETADVLDAELASQGVTLTEYQRDAMLSFLYNCGNGYAKMIVSAYKNGGNEGFWNAIKDFVNSENASNLPGLIRRREQEYELFTKGDYDYPY